MDGDDNFRNLGMFWTCARKCMYSKGLVLRALYDTCHVICQKSIVFKPPPAYLRELLGQKVWDKTNKYDLEVVL